MGNNKQSWKTTGFEAFAKGSFGNSGQNLYVSRAGILQRIHQFDLTGNGFVDLVFCNSQSHFEKPDSLIYSDPLEDSNCRGIRTHGCRAATLADLNGDGYDDLVLGHFKDGLATELNAMVYYGSPEGLTENYHLELPAPKCTGVAAGDFNGNGKIDLAFLTNGKLRLFYQTSLGFELKKYQDFDIEGQQIEAFDLDSDGFSDLLIRADDENITVYWGGPDGIEEQRRTEIPKPISSIETIESPDQIADESDEEFVADADPLVKIVILGGVPHVFCAQTKKVYLIPATVNRTWSSPLELSIRNAYSVAIGDINGNGFDDLVFAARDSEKKSECSWVYWGSADGYSENRRSALSSQRAADVAMGDLNANGCADVLIVQNRSEESFSTESLIYRGSREGIKNEPVRLLSHDARRGFIAQTSDENLPQVILASNFASSASDDLKNYIYFGTKEGYSVHNRKEVPGWGSFGALYADFNDDGKADLVFANGSEFSAVKDPGSYLYYNGKTGIGDHPDQILPTSAATVAVCADLDRNGYLDLVFCGFRKPQVLIFPGGPNGFELEDKITIPLEHEGKPYGFLFTLFLVDLTGDGWLDMIVGGGISERALILWGGPKGFSVKRSQGLAVYMPRTVTAADLSGNGYPDLIVGGRKPQLTGPHDAFLYVYWNGPDGIREDRRTMLPVKSTNGLAVADFNNDGKLDIFAGSYADGRERDLESYIYWNRKGRGFTLLDRLCLQTHAVGGCLAADLNEDGWIDLVVTNHKELGDHKGDSEIWWNGPEGFNVSRTTRLPTLGGRGPSVINPGNILDRGPEEYYISEPIVLPKGAVLEGLTWKAHTPGKTWVKGQLRVAINRGELDAFPWIGPDGKDSWWDDFGRDTGTALAGSIVQFRLALGAVNSCSSPRVSAVEVHYRILKMKKLPLIIEKGIPQLFVDDFLIESKENLKRTLHQPKKENSGNFPVLSLQPNLFGNIPGTLMANGTIVYDPQINKYVMFALAFAAALEAKAVDGWKRVKLLRYTSADGLHWEGHPDGSCEIVIPRSHEELRFGKLTEEIFHLDLFSCHYDSNNEKHPYQGWLFLRGREEETGVYHMQSTDGRIWLKGKMVMQRFSRELNQEGTFLMGPGDVSIFSADPKTNRFLGIFKFQNWKGKGTDHLLRSRAYLFVDRLDVPIDPSSIDRVDQVPPQKMQNGDEPDDEYYGSTAWCYGSHWLGGLKVFHVKGDHSFSSSGCAFLKIHCSRDGLHWNKIPFANEDGDAGVFICNGSEGGNNGTNDGGYLTEFTNPPLKINNELVFYYGASSFGKNHSIGTRLTGGGIFRARLRLDGFVSIDRGSLTTRPFYLPGENLYINHSGNLTVEVINETGKSIASENLEEDNFGVDDPVQFQGQSIADTILKSSQSEQFPVRLRFHIDKGNQLYSFSIK